MGALGRAAPSARSNVLQSATSEHVPPQSFFERPYPANLITVPACKPCNEGSQQDDAYFLAFLASRDVAGAAPSLDRVRERVTRGLHRPNFRGLRDRLIRHSELSARVDPETGLHELTLGTRPESDRVKRTIDKQVRGMAYYLTGRRVPKSTFTMLERVWGTPIKTADVWQMFIGAADYALRGTSGSVGDVFRYAHREVERSACAAVVRLEFYGVFPYVALLFRPDFAPPQRVRVPS
jgi:hypothetical protein